MLRLVVAALAFALTGFALISAGTAQAKGPFEVVISGGDVAGQVVIPVEEIDRLFAANGFFPPTNPGRPAPESLPDVTYSVELRQVLENGERAQVNTFVYYPAHGDGEARFRDDSGWYAIDPAFEALMDRYIASAARASSVSGTAWYDDAPSQVWYIATSLAAAAALFAGGLAGWRLLRRHRE